MRKLLLCLAILSVPAFAGSCQSFAYNPLTNQLDCVTPPGTQPSAGVAVSNGTAWSASVPLPSTLPGVPQYLQAIDGGSNSFSLAQAFLSQSPDCAVSVTSTTLTMGALATASTPCNVRIGSTVYSLAAPATATISACPTTNTANYVYVQTNGSWVLGTNTGVTATSTAQFVVATGTTAFPAGVVPIATVLCNTNAWVTSSGITDWRAFLSVGTLYGGGTGVTIVGPVISADTTLLTQKYIGTAAPGSVAGNLPGDLFSDTTNHNDYWCDAPNGTAAPACTSVTTGGWTLLNGVTSLTSGNSGLLLSASTGAVTATPQRPVTTVSAATYTLVSADAGAADDFTSTTGVAVTLPTAGTAPWTTGVTYHATCDVTNYNTCVFTPQATQTLTGSGLSAATSLTLYGNTNGGQGNQSVTLTVNGTNWAVSDLTPIGIAQRANGQYSWIVTAQTNFYNGITLTDRSYANSCSTTLSVALYAGEASGAKLTGNCTLSLTYGTNSSYTGAGLLVIGQDATGGHTLSCGTGWHMRCPQIDPAPNSWTVIPVGWTNQDSSGLANGIDGTYLTAGATVTAGQLLCTTTTAMQVVPCATSATNTFVGIASESAVSGATVIVATHGIVPNAILDSGTCAVGNWVIAGSTTAGSVKCTGTAPSALTMVGFAESAQSTVGSAVTVLVDKR